MDVESSSMMNDSMNGGMMVPMHSGPMAPPVFPQSSPGFLINNNNNTNAYPTSPAMPIESPVNNNNNNQAPLIGMVASGCPMRTDFVPSDPSGTKFTLSLTSPGDLPSPLTLVNELTFFLLPSAVLPPNTGIMIYWQLQIPNGGLASGFELLGTLVPSTRPSQIFRTGWAEHDQFLSLIPANQPAQINIGVSIEPLESVQNVDGDLLLQQPSQHSLQQQPNRPTTTTAVLAQNIGHDLFNYMRSFDTNGATGNQTIAVPANVFDKWWQRFERKLQRDPNFFLHKKSNNE
jgi:protein Hikeshi